MLFGVLLKLSPTTSVTTGKRHKSGRNIMLGVRKRMGCNRNGPIEVCDTAFRDMNILLTSVWHILWKQRIVTACSAPVDAVRREHKQLIEAVSRHGQLAQLEQSAVPVS